MNREIRTDLAIELRENVADRRNMPGVKVKTVVNEDRSIKTTTITVLDEIGEKNLGKAKGQYITIECSKLKEYEESIHEPLRAELEGRLRELMGHAGNILVVGLGNRQVGFHRPAGHRQSVCDKAPGHSGKARSGHECHMSGSHGTDRNRDCGYSQGNMR